MPRHLGAPFNGALVQAQILPARTSLKTLLVWEALVRRETPLNVSVSHAVLPTLTFLRIAFRLEQGYHNSTVLRTIVAACPHLQHLDFFHRLLPFLHHSECTVSPIPPAIPNPRLACALCPPRVKTAPASCTQAHG